MLAVHLDNGGVEVRTVPRPRRPPGFATIRLLYGGLCNTDLELQRGYYGFRGTPGHEFVGQVADADTRSLVGKRVVGEINLNCGKCSWCERGLPNHCPKRSVLGIVKHPGAFRELLTLPERNLHVVPRAVVNEHAVFTEPLAAACRIQEQLRMPKGTAVAVLGDGKLGLLVAQVLQAGGARVHQFGRHRHKLAIAEKAGVSGEVVQGKLPARRYPVVVEATGSAAGLNDAISLAEPCGTVVMKSTVHGEVGIDTAPAVVNEITLMGSRCGPFAPALKLLASRRVYVDDMIQDSIRLDYAPLAFERAAQAGVLKVLIHP
ncbi:MAG TPA: alcohol dehydrogenase catalytic domain-containing protein [Bryobacteraceae bacterium]|nr:alcohol dehydrogenase catalytic domain-containing protein [Bryobacteraceae bacterium]